MLRLILKIQSQQKIGLKFCRQDICLRVKLTSKQEEQWSLGIGTDEESFFGRLILMLILPQFIFISSFISSERKLVYYTHHLNIPFTQKKCHNFSPST
nr:hypothetical protein Itr_chr01CG15810 [Ipomoea trifida]